MLIIKNNPLSLYRLERFFYFQQPARWAQHIFMNFKYYDEISRSCKVTKISLIGSSP